MNENPEGTPNPLNQGMTEPAVGNPARPAMETLDSTPVEHAVPGMAAQTPTERPMTMEQTVIEQTTIEPRPAVNEPQSIQPVAQPATPAQPAELEFEPKDSIVEPRNKKSKKPIAAILAAILLLVAVGCGVAAIIILKPFSRKEDAVPAAMSKLMGGAPSLTKIDGEITMTTDSQSSAASSLQIVFEAGINSKSNESYVDATINAKLQYFGDFTFSANEIHNSDGNLYLKLGGIAKALQSYYTDVESDQADTKPVNECGTGDYNVNCIGDLSETTNCTVANEDGTTNCMTVEALDYGLSGVLGIIGVIDDEWIMIPDSEFSNITDLLGDNGVTQCLIGAAGTLSEYGSDFTSLYNSHPFINYSTDNITVAKKENTIYRLTFDTSELTAFINAMGNSGFQNELNACMNALAVNTAMTEGNLETILAEVPEIYVEIDDENNFTRVYMTKTISYTNGNQNISDTSEDSYSVALTADLSFSYPDSIAINEPTYYIEFNELLSRVLNQFYGVDVTE